ncbi:MAG: thiamine phosphate synthase [Desulfovibrio sp.]|jgi:thiamine-phosphate pyrophosphorylase|nr:thiamine phosphate synthase [Desulfovibrio sp.]
MIPFPDTDVYCITDSRQSLGRSNLEVVRLMLEAGARVIQYREKDLKAGQMLKECLEIRALTRERGVCFLVNDHLDIALLSDADGAHIGQDDIPLSEARRLLGRRRVIGVSTHRWSEAEAAITGGADYIGVGPIFPTATKSATPPVGYAYLEEAAAKCPIPFVTIGGINEMTIAGAAERGARCCAVVSAITLSEDIAGKITLLRRLMSETRK